MLVIDDSPDVHRLLRERLRDEEIELLAAEAGGTGLELARAIIPAMILLDLDMPGMDGFEVMRRLKDAPETREIPVIVLAGLQSAQSQVAAFDLGAVDFVTKPFNLTELRVRVRAALKTHRLVQMLAQCAKLDGLTGLWNRTYFDKRLSDELAAAARHSRHVSLAMLDVDDFKTINDTYGHPAGDAVLQGLARILQRECRQEDVACRYGGEEFTLILPDTVPEDATKVCERIRLSLAQAAWPRHPDRLVTLSVGVIGALPGAGATVGPWIEAADRALYAAKRSGRNRVVMAEAQAPAGLAG